MNTAGIIAKIKAQRATFKLKAVNCTQKQFIDVYEAILGRKAIVDESNRFAIKQVFNYLNLSPEFEGELDKSILLYGPKGTGKSTLLLAMNELLIGNERKAKFISLPQASDDFESKGVDALGPYKKPVISSESMYYTGEKRNHLIFDDIGREKIQAQNYADKRGVGATVIYDRHIIWQSHRVLTHYTTNFDMGNPVDFDVFVKRYGDLNADRMRETCNFIKIGGESKR